MERETMEIERQFLVKDVSMVPVNMSMAQYEISQGYLSFEPELRIRQMNDEYFFTFKSAGGLVRREEEFNLAKKDFENLLPRVQGGMLKKERHEILLPSGEMAIFDIYGGELDGLCIAEVEFQSVEDAKAFDPPAWFGKEITYDERLTAGHDESLRAHVLFVAGMTHEEIDKLMDGDWNVATSAWCETTQRDISMQFSRKDDMSSIMIVAESSDLSNIILKFYI